MFINMHFVNMHSVKRKIEEAEEKAYLKGLKTGRMEKNIPLSEESEFLLKETESLEEEDLQELKMLVNSESYLSLRKYIINHALILYREARGKEGEEMRIYVKIGDYLKDLVDALDGMKTKKEKTESISDPYEH